MTNPPEQDPYAYPTPPPGKQGQPAPKPPTEITAAFWGYLIAAVAGLIGGFLILGNKQQIADALRRANNQGGALTDAQIDQAATITVVIAVIVAVIFSLLYALFAYKLRAGRNWARVVLTVIAVLALLSLVLGNGGTVLGYISELAAVVAAVLSYLPASNAYFTAVKASRQLR
jgi:hypothetical protein